MPLAVGREGSTKGAPASRLLCTYIMCTCFMCTLVMC